MSQFVGKTFLVFMFWIYSHNTSNIDYNIRYGHEHEITFKYNDTIHLLYFTDDICTTDSIINK